MGDTDTSARMYAISERVAVAMVIAQTLTLDDVEEWERHAVVEQGRYDTVGPLLDPTGWQREHQHREQATRVAQAFAEFRRACEAPK